MKKTSSFLPFVMFSILVLLPFLFIRHNHLDEKIEDFFVERLEKIPQDWIADRSGIANSAYYQEYRRSRRQENGIRVTFAENDHLKVRYFRDKDLSEPIEEALCYLNPGDAVYAAQPEVNNPNTDAYFFDSFKVYEYADSGTRTGIDWNQDEEHLVFRIPPDYQGKELAVEPVGKYTNRILSLSAYRADENGTQMGVNGCKWTVRTGAGEQEYTGTVDQLEFSCEVNPLETYGVVLQYPYDMYYVLSTEPSIQVSSSLRDPYQGTVTFPDIRPGAENPPDGYFVQLHRWLTMKIDGQAKNQILSVSVNGEERDFERGLAFGIGARLEFDKLQVGDWIEIRTNENCFILYHDELITAPDRLENGGYSYTFSVTDADEQELNLLAQKEAPSVPSKRDADTVRVNLITDDPYGKVTFKLDKREVSGEMELPAGTVLTMEYVLTADGYRIKRDGLAGWNPFAGNSAAISIEIPGDLKDADVTSMIPVKREAYITVEEK